MLSGTTIATISSDQLQRRDRRRRGDRRRRRRRSPSSKVRQRISADRDDQQQRRGSRARCSRSRPADRRGDSDHGASSSRWPHGRRCTAGRTAPANAISQQHDRDRGGAGRSSFSISVADALRRRPRSRRDVAADQHDASRTRRSPGRTPAPAPASDRRQQRRQDDPAEDRAVAGAERGRGLLDLAVESRSAPAAPSARRTAASRTAARAPTRPLGVRADAMPTGLSRPVERQQHQAGDDRRQRERQVDDRVDEPLAAGSRRGPAPRRSACPTRR